MGIAKVLRSIGRSTKAIAVYQRAVDILEKKRGMGSEELVVPLSGLGNLLLSEGKAVEAENCFSRYCSTWYVSWNIHKLYLPNLACFSNPVFCSIMA